MARNKYPEETVNKILEVSLKLFLAKGYESTSIQDILNELGGLTKGAIYHHFKSKEEIFIAVADHIYNNTEAHLKSIREDKSLNGIQKLRKIFRSSLDDSSQNEMLAIAPNLLNNPPFLAVQLKSCIDEIAPLCILPILEEGIEDGSIHTNYPKELAEVLILLANIWLNPMIFVGSPETSLNRCLFFRELLLSLGLDILDDDMIERVREYAEIYVANTSQQYKK